MRAKLVRLRMALVCASVIPLCSTYAQVTIDSLRDRFENHLQSSERHNEQLGELELRVKALEIDNRQTVRDMIELKSTMEFTKTLMLCLGAPIVLIALETLLRLVSRQKRYAESGMTSDS